MIVDADTFEGVTGASEVLQSREVDMVRIETVLVGNTRTGMSATLRHASSPPEANPEPFTLRPPDPPRLTKVACNILDFLATHPLFVTASLYTSSHV